MDYLAAFEGLRLKTPRLSLHNVRSENSDYCSHAVNNKNCYLSHGSVDNEDCLYCTTGYSGNRDCVDCFVFNQCELCYECIDAARCYDCSFLQDCMDCTDCFLCFDCVGCENCFGCVGLRRKKWFIFNEQYRPEDYKNKIVELKKDSNAARVEFERLKENTPFLFMRTIGTENCVGDYVYFSKNCYSSFDVKNAEDCLYVDSGINVKDCIDCSHVGFGKGSEFCYETESAVDAYNCNFCDIVWYCSDMEYCDLCFNCRNCFFCVGLNRVEYCIFNQQYSPIEYEKKVTEIKAEMKRTGQYGKFFKSVFSYEDSKAMDFYPI